MFMDVLKGTELLCKRNNNIRMRNGFVVDLQNQVCEENSQGQRREKCRLTCEEWC